MFFLVPVMALPGITHLLLMDGRFTTQSGWPMDPASIGTGSEPPFRPTKRFLEPATGLITRQAARLLQPAHICFVKPSGERQQQKRTSTFKSWIQMRPRARSQDMFLLFWPLTRTATRFTCSLRPGRLTVKLSRFLWTGPPRAIGGKLCP